MSSQQTTYAAAEPKAYPVAYGYGYGYAAAPPTANPAPAPPGAGAAPPPSPEAAPPAGTLVSYVEEFNSILKKLTCELAIRYPNDATIDRAKKRIHLAMDIDPTFIIDEVGPYLYPYREEIYAGDADFFIENDYDAELKQSVDTEKAGLTAYIIPKVKTAWGESDADQQEAYMVTVQALLDIYLEYLALKVAKDGQ